MFASQTYGMRLKGITMRIDIYSIPDLFVAYSKEIEIILQSAVRQTIMDHKQAGEAIAIWKNGKIEIIKPEEIRIGAVSPSEQT